MDKISLSFTDLCYLGTTNGLYIDKEQPDLIRDDYGYSKKKYEILNPLGHAPERREFYI